MVDLVHKAKSVLPLEPIISRETSLNLLKVSPITNDSTPVEDIETVI